MSSTTSTQAFHRHAVAVASSVLDARLLPCYHVNDSPPDEMNRYVDQGAMSWTLYDHAHPLSTVFSRFNTLRVYGRLAGCLPIRLIEERALQFHAPCPLSGVSPKSSIFGVIRTGGG